MKIYGNRNTSLKLSEKALAVYSDTDPLQIIENDDGRYDITGAFEYCDVTADEVNSILEDLYDEYFCDDEDEEKPVVEISRIAVHSETFCTSWNGKLYCVDICEDSEVRSAWLYNAGYGVKSLMFGLNVKESQRDAFLDMVFSNLPNYIDDYAEEFED